MAPSTDSSKDDRASLEKEEKHAHAAAAVAVDEVDTAATIAAGIQGDLDPAEALRIRKKIDWHILPLMCILYLIQFMDKSTLGSAAILGIRTEAHLTANQYNWLGTIFYLSYLVFEFPQNLALQRFPVAKWMSINIFVWGVALASHAACKSFKGLFAVRFVLGMCEGSITAGFMIVTSMFYTRKEQALRVGYWFLMNGTALIISGFISFGTLHIKTTKLEPWQWLMLITGMLTLVTAVLFWFLFPDSPTNAWFFTPEERAIAVLRIKANQTGIENKRFKKEQMMEALWDPKTWLFALAAAFAQVPNSLTNQGLIIISSFGFSILNTTLLSCVVGVAEILIIWGSVSLVARTGSRAWVSIGCYVPAIMSVILLTKLPPTNRVGLLCSLLVTLFYVPPFVIELSWISSVTAGHTKRITTNAIVLCAYCIGNASGPFMWQARYQPRDRVPWTVNGVCFAALALVILALRYMLIAENKRRDAEPPSEDPYAEVYTTRVAADGSTEKVRVDKEFLDLTDRQNRDFRYVY